MNRHKKTFIKLRISELEDRLLSYQGIESEHEAIVHEIRAELKRMQTRLKKEN